MIGAVALVPQAWSQNLDTLLESESSEVAGDRAPSSEPPAGDGRAPEPETEAARVPRRVVEEIVVTAQKREERLHDVPISMSVLDAEFMAREGVADFRDVSFYVPNVKIDNARNAPDIRVRGFGSPIANQSIEQSVGLVIDGVAYGRMPYWIGPLFDLERVEALRGPQGTLFGKNTTAGVVSVVTRKPTDDLTGHVDVEIGELDRRKVDVAAGGPILPGFLNVRLSGLTDERDGYMKNTTAAVVPEAPERFLSRDRKAIRGQLGFPNVLGASLNFSAEAVKFSSDGNDGGELFIVQDPVAEFSRQYDPDTDVDPDNRVGSLDPRSVFNADLLTFVLQGSYDLAGWGLHALGGHSRLENQRWVNLDPTPAQVISAGGGDESSLTTFEARVDSPFLPGLFGLTRLFGLDVPGMNSNFTAGVFFQYQSVDDSNVSIPVNVPIAGQLLAAQQTGVVPPCPACARDSGVDTATVNYDQTTRSIAGFTQATWALTDRLSLDYGMRLTQESKVGDWVTSADGAFGGEAVLLLLAGRRFTEELTLSEFAFTPKVALRYAWTDDINLYGAWAKGFKSGGFNDTTFSNERRELLEFRSERMVSWEAGMKTRLLDGLLTMNLGLFRMMATDLQVFTTEPAAETAFVGLLATVNAGEARAQGVELDLSWLPLDWLTVQGALGFNDAKFLDFPFGGCSSDNPNTDGDDDPRCDLSGLPLNSTPKWTATVTTDARWPIHSIPGVGGLAPVGWEGIDLFGGPSVEYNDVHYTGSVGDWRSRQKAFFLFGGAVGLGNRDQGWSFRIVGRNLLDEYVTKFSQEGVLTNGTWRRTPAEPRLVSGSFRYEF